MRTSDMRILQISIIRDYKEEKIDGIYFAATESQKSLESELEKKEKDIEADNELSESDKRYYVDCLGDDHYESELIKELSEEMVIIALYKTVEIAIKLMLNRSGLFTEPELHSFYRIKALKDKVREKVVNIETLQGFPSYDELRCINNTIKHQGKVNNELASFNNWTEGDKLTDLWLHYNRLKPEVRKFVIALSEKLIEKITED